MSKKKKSVHIPADVNISELVDLGGKIHQEVKTKTTELDTIKTAIRTLAKQQKMENLTGTVYQAFARPHITVKVDQISAIFNYLGIRPSQIDPDKKYTFSGRDLALFLEAVSIPVAAIYRDFTEATQDSIIGKSEVPFHTISFEKISTPEVE